MASPEIGRTGDSIEVELSAPKKRLESVGGTNESIEDQQGRPEAESSEGERRGLPVWLFLLVFILFSLALVWQVREARQLEGTVVALEQDLAEAQALLGAHRDHLGEIRSGVEGLTERLGELRRLVEAGPETVRDAGDSRGSTASGGAPDAAAAGAPGSPSIPARLPAP